MFDKSFWIESTITTGTPLEHLIVVISRSSFVISLHFALCLWGAALDLGEFLRRLRQWLSLTGWLLCFSFLPLLLACLKVDLETGSSKLPPANVTHQGFRSLDDLGRCKVVTALETA